MATTDDPVQDFARRVKRLKHVMAVFSAGCAHQREVLTLLDDDYCRQTRGRVYGEEWDTHQRYPGVPIDFRVINAAEYPERELRDLVPTGSAVVWAREPERLAAALGRES